MKRGLVLLVVLALSLSWTLTVQAEPVWPNPEKWVGPTPWSAKFHYDGKNHRGWVIDYCNSKTQCNRWATVFYEDNAAGGPGQPVLGAVWFPIRSEIGNIRFMRIEFFRFKVGSSSPIYIWTNQVQVPPNRQKWEEGWQLPFFPLESQAGVIFSDFATRNGLRNEEKILARSVPYWYPQRGTNTWYINAKYPWSAKADLPQPGASAP